MWTSNILAVTLLQIIWLPNYLFSHSVRSTSSPSSFYLSFFSFYLSFSILFSFHRLYFCLLILLLVPLRLLLLPLFPTSSLFFLTFADSLLLFFSHSCSFSLTILIHPLRPSSSFYLLTPLLPSHFLRLLSHSHNCTILLPSTSLLPSLLPAIHPTLLLSPSYLRVSHPALTPRSVFIYQRFSLSL